MKTAALWVIAFGSIIAMVVAEAQALAACSGQQLGPIAPCSTTPDEIFNLAICAQLLALIVLTVIGYGRQILDVGPRRSRHASSGERSTRTS